jgi:hypothetical protein
VTSWGVVLLGGFLTLGLSRMGSRESMRAAVMLAVVVLVVMRFAVW